MLRVAKTSQFSSFSETNINNVKSLSRIWFKLSFRSKYTLQVRQFFKFLHETCFLNIFIHRFLRIYKSIMFFFNFQRNMVFKNILHACVHVTPNKRPVSLRSAVEELNVKFFKQVSIKWVGNPPWRYVKWVHQLQFHIIRDHLEILKIDSDETWNKWILRNMNHWEILTPFKGTSLFYLLRFVSKSLMQY